MTKYDLIEVDTDKFDDTNTDIQHISPTAHITHVDVKPLIDYTFRYSLVKYVLICDLCDSLTFFAILANLPLYLTRELAIDADQADYYLNILTLCIYLIPLLSGLVADTYVGRYKTTLFCLITYMFSTSTLTLSSYLHSNNITDSNTLSHILFVIGVVAYCISGGGIKAVLNTVGADQLEGLNCSPAVIDQYFSIFYQCIALGAILSYTLIAYTCQNISFTIGFMIPAATITIGTVVFYCGRHTYAPTKLSDSTLSLLFGVLYYSCTHRRNNGQLVMPVSTDDSQLNNNNEKPLLLLPTQFTDTAKISCGGVYADTQVSDLQQMFCLLPFVVLFGVYWCLYQQIATTFYNQSCQMNVYMFNIRLPVAVMSVIESSTIVILTPVFVHVIYPFIEHTLHIECTMLRKAGTGYIAMILSMLCAATLETIRLHYAANNEYIGPSICMTNSDSDTIMAVNLSMLWQAPQFALIGLSEILAASTAMELFFTSAPASMKSLCVALQFSCSAVGSGLSAVMIAIVNIGSVKWVTRNANTSHLNYFWCALAVLMSFNTLLFVYVARKFKYHTTSSETVSDHVELIDVSR